MEILNFLKDNYQLILQVLGAIVVVAELVVRMTPTEKDDSAVERIGGILRKIMDFLKVPNVKKNDLKLPKE